METKKKHLFIIYTPYQLLSALNIYYERKLNSCYFVLVNSNMRKFIGYYDNFEGIKTIDLSEIYDDNVFTGFKAHLQILKDIPRKNRIISKQIALWQDVDELFIPSDDMIVRIIYKKVKKNNAQVILSLMDDGIGTYNGRMHYRKRLLSVIFYAIFLNKNFYESISYIYCYHPELFKTSLNGIEIKKIMMNQVIVASFYPLASKAIDSYLGKKIIFLDQGYVNDHIQECLKCISRHFNNEEVIIKKHPRIDTKVDYLAFHVVEDGLPTEILFPLLKLDNTLVVSVDSTGCITPYLINEITPYCILLFEVLNKDDEGKCRKLFETINKGIGYNYVLMPKSVDEFEKMLVTIKNKLQGIVLE